MRLWLMVIFSFPLVLFAFENPCPKDFKLATKNILSTQHFEVECVHNRDNDWQMKLGFSKEKGSEILTNIVEMGKFNKEMKYQLSYNNYGQLQAIDSIINKKSQKCRFTYSHPKAENPLPVETRDLLAPTYNLGKEMVANSMGQQTEIDNCNTQRKRLLSFLTQPILAPYLHNDNRQSNQFADCTRYKKGEVIECPEGNYYFQREVSHGLNVWQKSRKDGKDLEATDHKVPLKSGTKTY